MRNTRANSSYAAMLAFLAIVWEREIPRLAYEIARPSEAEKGRKKKRSKKRKREESGDGQGGGKREEKETWVTLQGKERLQSLRVGNGRTRYQTGSMTISDWLNHATRTVKEQTLFLKGLHRPKTKKGYIVNDLRRTPNSAFSLLRREEYIWIVEQAEESAVGFMSYELGSAFLADESGQISVRDLDSAAVREQENAAPAELPESLEEVRWVDLEFEGEVVESATEKELREALSADAVGVFMEIELNSRERDSLHNPTQIPVEGPEGVEVQHPVPEDFSPDLTVDGEDSLSLFNRARAAREA
uniref:Uncharacterized protein n=1 Tax=Chromera velia CCMP2878 TaxID=1169474 RepID=A0A0G4HWI7_9ALVE|eukprot:Cvel_32635.t1-p1 / transcript=Cvel_32635.t1 / gene=Cvel_32635 / organism=Chromera_velia_CCMP2878 / gene_product=hypothetical protein / transcript_product=hypothetical protein / location=Cvel_scaffold5123:1325-2569(+) / protein_length=301 / sequence_SO=supercontig / SO=protein_coding / is_pseudo=false